MTNKMALIVAVILGVLSIIGIRSYVEKVKKDAEFDQEKIPFLVAGNDLQAGHVVTEDDISQVSFHKDTMNMALKGTFVSPNEKQAYLGARLRTNMKAGQVYLKDNFSLDKAGVEDPSANLGADERLVTIPVDQMAGLNGLLRPGDFVDVVVTMTLTSRTGQTYDTTHTLLRYKPIIATGTSTSRYSIGPNIYDSVTLRLDYKEASKLIHTLHKGALIHLTKCKEGSPPSATRGVSSQDTIFRDVGKELNRR